MIDFMSSWAEQIVLAVIVATILEMILPKSKNKKYIQMVIGVYLLFNIISPIIKNKDEFSIEKYNIENYQSKSKYEIDQTSMDKKLEKIYLDELENTVKSKFEINNIEVAKCKIDAVLDTTKKNAGIHSIKVKIRGENNENTIVKIKGELDNNKLTDLKTEISKELEIDENKIIIK